MARALSDVQRDSHRPAGKRDASEVSSLHRRPHPSLNGMGCWLDRQQPSVCESVGIQLMCWDEVRGQPPGRAQGGSLASRSQGHTLTHQIVDMYQRDGFQGPRNWNSGSAPSAAGHGLLLADGRNPELGGGKWRAVASSWRLMREPETSEPCLGHSPRFFARAIMKRSHPQSFGFPQLQLTALTRTGLL